MGSLTTEVLKNSVRMQTLNTAFLFTSSPVDSTTFTAEIKCHSKTLPVDRFKGRKNRKRKTMIKKTQFKIHVIFKLKKSKCLSI